MVRTQGRTAGRGSPSSGTSSCSWAAAPVEWFQTPHLLLNLPPHQSQVDTHLAALTPDLTPRSALIRLPGRGGAWVLPPTTRGPPGTRYDSLYLIITLLYSACPLFQVENLLRTVRFNLASVRLGIPGRSHHSQVCVSIYYGHKFSFSTF